MQRPKQLSASFVKTISQPGRYGDGRGGYGLSLLVKPTSSGRLSKSWSQRLQINGQAVNVGLGSYPVVTLAVAREKALANRRVVSQGNDPRGTADRAPRFADAVERVIGIHSCSWKDGGKTAGLWRSSLNAYAMPRLGRKTVDAITSSDIMGVLVPIWTGKGETAKKVRQRMSAVMKWAIAEGFRDDNPAGEIISAALPKTGRRVTHQRALPHADVGAALATIRESKAWPATKLAFEFLTLTACRSNEARLADWGEIDLATAIWTIPPARTKAGREHRIPLSNAALRVLRQARDLSDGTGLVFPSQRGRPLTDSTISKLARENGIGCVPHGMRSSFRDWAAECSDVPREVAEHALGHIEGSASELAYRRTDFLERRARLMQEWGAYVGRG